jgi:di/tricarboxylate transporter
MLTPLVITWLVLIGAILLLLTDRVRPDLVALLVIVILGVTGVLTVQETFSGFSRSAVITIMAIFILAEGLQRTGVTDQVGRLLVRVAGRKEGWLASGVMMAGAFLSLFMNNIAAAAVLLPAVSGAARKVKVNPSRLLMPLAFATILGGMATLFTTSNILVSTLLHDQGLQGFGVLDFLPLGVPIIVVGVGYIAFLGRRWLPAQPPIQRLLSESEGGLADVYRLGERLFRVKLLPDSPLAGVALETSGLRELYNLNVVAIEHNRKWNYALQPATVFNPGDVLLVEGRQNELNRKFTGELFEVMPPVKWAFEDLDDSDTALVEMVLAPRSRLIGQTLKDVHFREKFQMSVLGIWRSGRPIRTGLSDLPLQFGDALLLQGPGEQIPVLQTDPEIIVFAGPAEKTVRDRRKALPALIVMGVTLALAIALPNAIGEIMLGGALVMVLVGAITMDQAYQAIDWKSVFLVAGMLPLGIAMSKTGAAASLVDAITAAIGPAGPWALLVVMAGLGVLLTQVMSSAAVAAILIPITIELAQHAGADPRSMAMGVAMAISMNFITPLSHPVNVLVMGPGGYQFKDYVRVGLPLTVILFILVMLLLPVFWPLNP